MFNKEQKDFMLKMNIMDNTNRIDEAEIEESVSALLIADGFDENYNPNKIGLMCESILDSLE